MGKIDRKLGWAWFWAAAGVCALVALLAAPGLPNWSVIILTGLVGLCFSMAAYHFGWFKAPSRIGTAPRVTIVLGLIWGGALYLGWRSWPRVIVYPEQVVFQSQEIHDNYIFTVQNRTDDDAYAVVVKFKIVSGELSVNDLSVDIPLSSRKPVMDRGMQAPDAMILRCFDVHDLPVRVVVFVRLTPSERREVSIMREQGRHGTLAAEISNFRTDQLSQRQNSALFDMGEPMRCNQYSIAPPKHS